MSPLILVYVLLILAIIVGLAIAFLRYQARNRSANAPGQAHVAEPLPKPGRTPRDAEPPGASRR